LHRHLGISLLQQNIGLLFFLSFWQEASSGS
jgi:hypothetical protein